MKVGVTTVTQLPLNAPPNYTMGSFSNPATGNTVLTKADMWFNIDATSVYVAVGILVAGGGWSYKSADFESLGNVTSGAKRTYIDLNLTTLTDHKVSIYSATGSVGYDSSGDGMSSGQVAENSCADVGAWKQTDYWAGYSVAVNLTDETTPVAAGIPQPMWWIF